MEYVNLKRLPEAHPLRNALLVEIGAEFKHISAHVDAFAPVEPGRPMAEYTYNTLEMPWINFMDWRVPKPV
jgi:hypothetical protein